MSNENADNGRQRSTRKEVRKSLKTKNERRHDMWSKILKKYSLAYKKCVHMCWFACGAILTSSQLSLIPHFYNFLPPSKWLHVMRSTHKQEWKTTAKESATRPQRSEVGTKLFLRVVKTCWHCKYDETQGKKCKNTHVVWEVTRTLEDFCCCFLWGGSRASQG